jgi:hypothetical protein
MIEHLPRLVDDPAVGESTKAIVRSAGDDAPSAEARARAARALGLGVAVGLTTTAASTTASGLSWWIVPAIVMGLATATGIGVWQHDGTDAVAAPVIDVVATGGDDRAPGVDVAETQPEAAVTAAPEARSRRVIAPIVEPAPAVEPVVPAAAPPAAPASPAAPDARRLAAEVALLDRARGELARGAPAASIAILDRHDAEFADGQLHAEAALLRIEAVLRAGDRARAETLAAQFHERFPGSPLARRVRSLISARQP